MNKQVLIEYLPFKPLPQQLQEVRFDPTKNLIVSGLIQCIGRPNANKRVYGESLRTEVEKYAKGPIAEKRALGELDHPETGVINLKNVCHNITKLWWNGNELYGEFEVLPTPSGNILKQLFMNGINVGISSRAMGSVRPLSEELVQVEDDLELICWDFVSTPSTFGAFVQPVGGLNESYQPQQQASKYTRANQLISEIICTQTGICCLR